MATELVLVCSSFDGATCVQQEFVQAYLLPATAGEQLDLLLQGGFSAELFNAGFMGMLTLFATGFGIGLVLSVLRKAKR